MIRTSFIFFVLFFCFQILVSAQTFGGGFTLGFPQSEFKEVVDNVAYGFNLEGTIWAPSKTRPFAVGLNVGYLIYGDETQRQPFSRTIGRVEVNVNTTNSLLNFHLMFKISPFSGTWRPYLDGLFGGNYIFTRSSVEDITTGEDVVGSTNFDDFSFSYGSGGGLLILLTRDEGDITQLYLDLKARFLFGSTAEYLKEGSILEDANGNVTYEVQKSKTDILTFLIGVVAYF